MDNLRDWLWTKLSEWGAWLLQQLWGMVQWFFMQFQTFGQWILDTSVEQWAQLLPGVDWSPLQSGLASANYFLPLGEAMAMLTGLVTLWVTTFIYKLIKSWIPTVGT